MTHTLTSSRSPAFAASNSCISMSVPPTGGSSVEKETQLFQARGQKMNRRLFSVTIVQNLMSQISFPCSYCVRVANLRGYGLLKVQTIVKQFNCDWTRLNPPLFIAFKIKTMGIKSLSNLLIIYTVKTVGSPLKVKCRVKLWRKVRFWFKMMRNNSVQPSGVWISVSSSSHL